MGTVLSDIQTLNQAGANPPNLGLFVVYDLPDRDCAAAASNGEYTIADNGVANYKAYINSIAAQLTTYSDVHVILIIGRLSRQCYECGRCGSAFLVFAVYLKILC
jgi:cellulose 1,4-beta-cellobiosidase